MIKKEYIENFLKLIPQEKFVSYQQLADIFCTSSEIIQQLIGKHDQVLEKKLDKNNIRIPKITNHYVSLTTKDQVAIGYFETLSRKIYLLHPGKVLKVPTYYHITLADLSTTKIDTQLIMKIFGETEELPPFLFHCTLNKPYIDKKKNKVIFWVNIKENPFLITLHQCIKKHVPRRTDKQFIPHITLGKILGSTEYNNNILESTLNIHCLFDELCVVANIDAHKDMVLFSKTIS